MPSRSSSLGLVFVVLSCLPACGSSLGRPVHLTSGQVESAELRHEHSDLGQRLEATRGLVDALAKTEDVEVQRRLMGRLVIFFTAQVGEHVRWEEARVYPIVDRYVGGGTAFTASLRNGHALIARWTSELSEISASDTPDLPRFVRTCRDLVGLTRAQMASEDAVLLPLLERSLVDVDRRSR